MTKPSAKPNSNADESRRDFISKSLALPVLAASATVVSACAPLAGSQRPGVGTSKLGPYKSLRDYYTALEDRNLVVNMGQYDSSSYEFPGLLYRLVDQFGVPHTPCVAADQVKVDGDWINGKLLANHTANGHTNCIALGIEPDPDCPIRSFKKAREHCMKMYRENKFKYPEIPPKEISREQAPCKEVVLTGDEIDITKFQFIQGNPADAGRYINTATVITSDPELGYNLAIYRCQIKGKDRLMVNSEPGQTGWKMFQAAKKRGEKTVPIALAVGQDPLTWTVSGGQIPIRRTSDPVDEYALAGGLGGQAIEVVKGETTHHMVPAHAEIIIEGEVLLDEMAPEGPYHELFGYMGDKKEENYSMRITSITHRKDPWVVNSFTSVAGGILTAPDNGMILADLQNVFKYTTDFATITGALGTYWISIKKTKPKQAKRMARFLMKVAPIAKVIVIVDDDVDVYNRLEVLNAISTRWRMDTATHIDTYKTLILDPGSLDKKTNVKVIIDATLQLPEEGGVENFPEKNRTNLKQGSPGIFERIDKKYADILFQTDWS
ncbi:UbiD family decarboxylase [Oceanicoccus sagamiensis]|uniref:UbiD family decarboxylase n=1 Tax=Oceanicoccus sagamiensis TaxID=716816 RepID=A0A1X9N5B8_9GAMM|nr:UbiD family decarboxylase [Oceanicoccus sagamiensis]ARN72926.1 hypothetical protein BST96_01680 [Oceanicoccus sagamiensis]